MPIEYAQFPTNVPGPSYPIDKQSEPRIKRASFGDGYTQQSPDGINFNLYTWNLNWDALTTSEKNIIELFLEGKGGYQSFQWTDPNDDTFIVKCPSWSVSNFEPAIFKITATFKEAPL